MSVIYAVQAIDGSIKVGRTAHFALRMGQLADKHGPLMVLARVDVPRDDLVRSERLAHSLMRWWRRAGEWYEPTRWARQLASEWAAAKRIFCPKWLYWIDPDTRAPVRDWRLRGDPPRGLSCE